MAQVKHSRLIALGCSHTYGHGLEDCFVPPHGYGPNPSIHAWPNKLAQLLNIETVVNLALPGCSNKYILHSATTFDFHPNDLVIALWTYNDRTGIFKSNEDYHVIAHWDHNKYSKKFIKSYYSDYDITWQNSIYIDYLRLTLERQNIAYFYDCLEGCVSKDPCFLDLKFNQHRKDYNFSLDGYHMDSLGHAAWAEQWYKAIQAHYTPESSISNH